MPSQPETVLKGQLSILCGWNKLFLGLIPWSQFKLFYTKLETDGIESNISEPKYSSNITEVS